MTKEEENNQETEGVRAMKRTDSSRTSGAGNAAREPISFPRTSLDGLRFERERAKEMLRNIGSDVRAALDRLEAENAKMRETLLIIAGGKDARGNYEEVAWHMAQFAAEALAAEGGAE